jgi:hypothetical protein
MDQRPTEKSKTVKLLGENIEVNLCSTGFGNEFLNIIPKYRQQKKKIDKLDLIKIKNFYVSKSITKSENITHKLEKYLHIIF